MIDDFDATDVIRSGRMHLNLLPGMLWVLADLFGSGSGCAIAAAAAGSRLLCGQVKEFGIFAHPADERELLRQTFLRSDAW